MPKVPRDCTASRLIKLLQKDGYVVKRQTGSHIRLYSSTHDHSITVPDHSPLKIGTLSAILAEVSSVTGIEKATLISEL